MKKLAASSCFFAALLLALGASAQEQTLSLCSEVGELRPDIVAALRLELIAQGLQLDEECHPDAPLRLHVETTSALSDAWLRLVAPDGERFATVDGALDVVDARTFAITAVSLLDEAPETPDSPDDAEQIDDAPGDEDAGPEEVVEQAEEPLEDTPAPLEEVASDRNLYAQGSLWFGFFGGSVVDQRAAIGGVLGGALYVSPNLRIELNVRAGGLEEFTFGLSAGFGLVFDLSPDLFIEVAVTGGFATDDNVRDRGLVGSVLIDPYVGLLLKLDPSWNLFGRVHLDVIYMTGIEEFNNYILASVGFAVTP